MSATPANIAKNRSPLTHLYNELLNHFGPRHWWPADSSWEMMVGAILTQNTNWGNVERAITSLKAAKVLSLDRIAALPRRRLEKLIKSSGFFRQKAERLQRLARYLNKHPSFYRQLRGQPGPSTLLELREELLALNGIGPETADSILLYAGGHPSFVVDAYTRRIGKRIGLFQFDDYDQVKAFFEDALPRKAPLYNEFHAQIVWLAKHYCKSRDPLCKGCPLLIKCRFGQAVKKES
jgi:endonuclease III related protein